MPLPILAFPKTDMIVIMYLKYEVWWISGDIKIFSKNKCEIIFEF